MDKKVLEQMATQLGYMGYNVEIKEDLVLAKHEIKPNFALKAMGGGILLKSGFRANEKTSYSYDEFLELMNELNKKAIIVRFFADEDRDLALEAWFPPVYDPHAFGLFLSGFDRDVALLHSNPEMREFLA
jgi:hypothetical protein